MTVPRVPAVARAVTGAVSGAVARPRVEGDREREVLTAALEVLADVGYDRLTMDSVAQRARASKATLYRRWSTKSALVIDALVSTNPPPAPVDTGDLRADLLATFCGHGGITDDKETRVFGSVMTAIMRDEEFATAFRRDVIGPKAEAVTVIFDRARARGQVGPDVDLDVLAPCLAGTVLHRLVLLGERPTPELVARVVDQIILPAATRGAPGPSAGTTATTSHQETP